MAIMITRGWLIGAFVFQIVLLVLFYNYFQAGQVFLLKGTSTSENFDLLKQREFLGDWNAVDTGRKPKVDIDWTEIPRKPVPKAEDMHDKWIVVTTISSPTEDVKKLAAMDGWKVVVVGDTKTPADWR